MSSSGTLPAALRALVTHIVDYAGLYPPAALDMEAAVRHFAACRSGEHEWMLGRFVVPAAQLDEFAAAASPHLRPSTDSWRLSALLGAETAGDVELVQAFNESWSRRSASMVVEAVEARGVSAATIERLAPALPHGLEAYVEIPVVDDPAPMISALAAHRLRAKIRTGGVTAELFPTSAQVARFLLECIEARVPFKATAGLHHAVRGSYPLTYEENADCTTMQGFVPLFLAAALLRDGLPLAEAVQLLDEEDAGAFRFTDDAARWRGNAVTTAHIAETRARAAIAFGSCSFEEPVAELGSWIRHRES